MGESCMEQLTYEELSVRCEQLQKQLQYYDEFDILTGVYNKGTFYRIVQENLKQHPKGFIVCVDVERFKVINDLYGSEAGNELLQHLAVQLQQESALREGIFARLGADVFAAWLPHSIDFDRLEEVVVTIFKNAPVEVDLVPAIGVYVISEDSLSTEKMCDRAILALNSIKGNYIKHCMVYDDDLWSDMLLEQEIINRADYALRNGEFKVVMQPKCNMRTGKVVGAEALVRWHHAERGLISPAVFIPVFEKNGFIKKLDIFVWEEVVKWICRWVQAGNRPIPISVNVSRIDIVGMDLFTALDEILHRYRVPPSLLELEITESAYSSHLEEIIITVEKLMCSGYTILMDDFGSGYSSLNMLKDININILKLDLRFLDNTNQKSRDILTSIVHMAKWLNLRIIVEGVETKGQVDFLLDIGCEYAQGYYYYRPMSTTDFEQLLLQESDIDYEDHKHVNKVKEQSINFQDLFHTDMMSEQLLNNMLGAVALYQYYDGQLKVMRCNDEYCKLLRQPDAQPEMDVLTKVFQDDVADIRRVLEDAKTKGDKGTEIVVRRHVEQQEVCWVQLRLFYLAETNGKSLYYASVSDMTMWMTLIEEMRVSDQRFRLAIEASGSVLFELDIPDRKVRYSSYTQEEYGFSNCVMDAPEGFIREGAICAEFADDFRNMYEEIYSGKERASCVIQTCNKEGERVWNRFSLIAIRNEMGENRKAVGLLQNFVKEAVMEERI